VAIEHGRWHIGRQVRTGFGKFIDLLAVRMVAKTSI
jgi:hypothetical protein